MKKCLLTLALVVSLFLCGCQPAADSGDKGSADGQDEVEISEATKSVDAENITDLQKVVATYEKDGELSVENEEILYATVRDLYDYGTMTEEQKKQVEDLVKKLPENVQETVAVIIEMSTD